MATVGEKIVGSAIITKDFGFFKASECVDVYAIGTNTLLCGKKGDKDLLTVPKILTEDLTTKAPPHIAASTPTVSASLSSAEESVLASVLGTSAVFEGEVSKKVGKKYATTSAVNPPIVEEPPKPELKENQIWFTSLTNGRLPISKIDHIIDIYPAEFFEEDIRIDIPTVDPNYHWDTEVLELLVLAHQLNKKVLLTGLPGTGKSSAIKQFAGIIRQPYMRFNGKDGVEPSSFLGYPWAGKEGMVWKDGLLPTGCLKGYLVTIDEVFKLSAGIQMAMQCLYEDGGHLMLDDKPGTHADKLIIPNNEFRLFMTDNVKGTGDNMDMFAATQMQDTSTLDRFAMVGEVNYLGVTEETSLLKRKYPKIKTDLITKMVKVAGLIRNGYRKGEISVTLSPRGLFTICELMNKGLDIKTSMVYSFMNKLGEDDEKRAVNEILRTVGV